MTRNRELDCEDLFGCTHEPETPIVDSDGDILYWQCRCGEKHAPAVEDGECMQDCDALGVGCPRTTHAIPERSEKGE